VARYEHQGAAAATTLSSAITASSTTINITSATGWPTGAVGPFWVTIDAGTASEEKVLITSRTGTALTVSSRGADGTTATPHANGAAIEHTFSATEADAANAHIEASSGVHGRTGSLVGTTDTQTLTNKTLALGSNAVSGTVAQFNTALSDGDFATLAGTETLANKTLTAPAATGSLASFGGAWTSYTPTVTQGATVTATVNSAKYTRIGKLVVGYFMVTITGAGTATNLIQVGLPVTPLINDASPQVPCGSADIFDISGPTNYVCSAHLFNGTVIFKHDTTAGGAMGSTGGYTAAANDIIYGIFFYEAA